MSLDASFIGIIEARYETINYPETIFIKKVNFLTVKKFYVISEEKYVIKTYD